MFIPRYYQIDAKAATFDFLANEGPEKHPVIAMPTGTGKGYCVADFNTTVQQNWRGMRVLNLTHSSTLIRQNVAATRRLWSEAPIGIYSAKLGFKQPDMPIVFGGLQSVYRNLNKFGMFDLINIDECHMTSPNQNAGYRKIFEHFRAKNKYLRAVGYTATPYRLGLGMITDGGLFTDIAYDITGLDAFNRLIDEAYLMPLVPMPTVTHFDLSGVKKQGGEYNEKQAQAAMNVEEITRQAVAETLELTRDRKHILVFSQGIDHANSIARMFHEQGHDAGVYHSDMPQGVQDQMLAAFQSGRLRILVNADMLTTGFDMPSLDCIVMLRATASTALWVQMLGRGTRPWYAEGFDLNTLEGRRAAIHLNGKFDCLVLDFAGNTGRLGPINDPMTPKKKGDKAGVAPAKRCKADNTDAVEGSAADPCGMWNYTSARFCCNRQCNRKFHFRPTITCTASTAALVAGKEEKEEKKPVYEWFEVQAVTYKPHQKMGSPLSIQVTYFCDSGRQFREWVCLEHEGHAGAKARGWWRKRFNLTPEAGTPPSTTEALKWIDDARRPVRLFVQTNEKYPVITQHLFKEELEQMQAYAQRKTG